MRSNPKSRHVLKLMRKGVTAHQNIALLRAARAAGLSVIWNYLYGFPGEEVADYAEVTRLIPALEHLHEPEGLGGLLIDRFSPYFNDPQSFGIERIAPRRGYRGLYPPDAPLDDIAYHFRGKYSTPYLDDPEARDAMARAIGTWQLQWRAGNPPRLEVIEERGDGAVILDTRRIAVARETLLSHAAMAVLRHFERGLPAESLVPGQAGLLGRFLIAHEGKLLSVVVRPPEVAATPAAQLLAAAS